MLQVATFPLCSWPMQQCFATKLASITSVHWRVPYENSPSQSMVEEPNPTVS